jgi:hypothetical protein
MTISNHVCNVEIFVSFMNAFTGLIVTVMVWLARFCNVGYWTAIRIFRLLLASDAAAAADLIWAHAILKVIKVTSSQFRPWNRDWQKPNSTADIFFGTILSL